MSNVPETPALRKERKADIDIMGAIRKERGEASEKRKSAVDLIWESVASQMPPGVDREKFVIALAQQIKAGPHKLLQVGNTVFLMTAVGPGTIEFVTFTREPLAALVQRYRTAADIVRKMGVKKVRAWSADAGMQRIVKSVGLPVTFGQGEKMLYGKMVPVFTFEINLAGE